jgi:hypothetical protein
MAATVLNPENPEPRPFEWLSVGQKRMLLWGAALAGSALLLMLPALWNGFPFLFYDSGAYIDLAIRGGFQPERSAFYAAFLGAFRPGFSLWPAMVAQSLVTVLLMAEFARVLLPGLTPRRFLLMVLALGVGTVLPWEAADILPDILAALLVMALYLLGFHPDTLPRWRRMGLVAFAIYAATSHASHLGLAAGLAMTVALMQVFLPHRSPVYVTPRWKLPALVFTLSLMALVTSNFLLTGEIFVSRAGPSFLLARLVQDGIAKRLLDDTCPGSGYRLCPYKDNLPADSNDYLWGWQSPFQQLGKFAGMADESESMIIESLRRYPLMNLKAAILDTAEQFVTFKTGDGIEPLNGVPVPILARDMPRQLEPYLTSRQNNGRISFDWIDAVQTPIGALSIAALPAIFLGAVRQRQWDDRFYLPLFMLLALLGNAFICGALSSPHDRYQARLVWLACFVVLLFAARRPGLRPVPGQ